MLAASSRNYGAVAEALRSAKCPRCGGEARSFEGRSRTMTCIRGHVSAKDATRAHAAEFSFEQWKAAEARSQVLGLSAAAEIAAELGRPALAAVLGLRAAQARAVAPSAETFGARVPPPSKPAPMSVPVEPAPVARRRPRVSADGIAEIAFVGPINDATAEAFIEDLAAAASDKARVALLTLTTEGGALSAAARMVAAVEVFPGRVVAFIPVRCNSAGSLVLMACDYAIARVGSEMVIHAPPGGDDETRAAWREHLVDIYSSSTGLNDMTCRERFNGVDTRLDACEALARHFLDDVGDRYRARTVAELFAAGRPPASGRQVTKAIKRRCTAGRRR
jgi:ATP-dependent protease ClpP protease subunit